MFELVDAANQAAIISQPVAFVEDRKAAGTDGGTSSATPVARDLNTLSGDIAAVNISLNATDDGFVLNESGYYFIKWSAPAYDAARHMSALYNETTNSYIKLGTSETNDTAANSQTRSHGSWKGYLPGGTELAIYHEVQISLAGAGWGNDNSTSLSIVTHETYTRVEVERCR